MFESNFPVDKMGIGWAALWNALKRIAAGASADEKRAMFSGTARRVYRLDSQAGRGDTLRTRQPTDAVKTRTGSKTQWPSPGCGLVDAGLGSGASDWPPTARTGSRCRRRDRRPRFRTPCCR